MSFIGYNFEKIEGYVFTQENDGLVPIYRFYNKDLHDHVLSLREDEFSID